MSKPTIQIRTKSTGLYFVAGKGFVASKREDATAYEDTAAIRAAFKAQYYGQMDFIAENQYVGGAASIPAAPLTQAEIDADMEEKKNWLPFPMMS